MAESAAAFRNNTDTSAFPEKPMQICAFTADAHPRCRWHRFRRLTRVDEGSVAIDARASHCSLG